MTRSWTTRYPDLTGKVVVVAGESSFMVAICAALTGNGVLLALVAPDRAVVDEVMEVAVQLDVATMGIVADPSDPAIWERISSQIEQRLGPIDVGVAIATAPTREVITDALLPTMARRQRGVLIVIGSKVSALPRATGVRNRGIQGTTVTAPDLAAAVLLCASDTVAAESMLVSLA